MTVERDRTITLHLPKNVSKNEIDNFLDRKKFWLHSKINHKQKYPPKQIKEYLSGTSITYLGRNYKFEIITKKINGVIFKNRFYVSKNNLPEIDLLLKEWYIKQANQKFNQKTEIFAKQLGVKYNMIKISYNKYRWGSCTPKNNLTFNWKLMKAPIHVIEYVIVHELAHLIEENHSDKFWSIVKSILPKYAESKNWLKEYGYYLE